MPRGKPEEAGVNQIVLPRECRKAVPLGGHLGKKKMAARIMQRFYWLSLFRDVAEFCRSCTQCQCAGHRRVARVPAHGSITSPGGALPKNRDGHCRPITSQPGWPSPRACSV